MVNYTPRARPLTPLLFLNALLVGVFAFAALHYFNVWWLSRTTRVPAVIAIYALLNALQMIAVFVLNSSTDLRLSQIALDARSGLGITSGAALVWLIAELTHFKPRTFLLTMTVVPLVLAAINLVTPIAGQVTAINEVVLPWGETARAVERQGTIVWLALLAYLSILSVYAFGALAGWRLARRDRVGGLLTVVAGVLSMGNAVYAFLIDLQGMRAPYFGLAFSAVWILVATVLFSREHAARAERLKASEARLAAVIANSPGVAVQWFDDGGRVVLWNHASEQLFGIPTADAVGKTLDQLFYPP